MKYISKRISPTITKYRAVKNWHIGQWYGIIFLIIAVILVLSL